MSDWVQKGVNIIFILLFLLNTYIAIMDAMEDVPNMDYHVSKEDYIYCYIFKTTPPPPKHILS